MDIPAVKTKSLELLRVYHDPETSDCRKSKAKADIVQLNKGLVYRAANRHKSKISDVVGTLEDLEQEGFIGLLNAIDSYDASKVYDAKNSFSAYAQLRIEGKIRNYKSDNINVTSVPRQWVELKNAVRTQQRELHKLTGVEPSEVEVAKNSFGLTAEQWAEIKRACCGAHYVPLDPGSYREETFLLTSPTLSGLPRLELEERQAFNAAKLSAWIEFALTPVEQTLLREALEGVETRYLAKRHALSLPRVELLLSSARSKLEKVCA